MTEWRVLDRSGIGSVVRSSLHSSFRGRIQQQLGVQGWLALLLPRRFGDRTSLRLVGLMDGLQLVFLASPAPGVRRGVWLSPASGQRDSSPMSSLLADSYTSREYLLHSATTSCTSASPFHLVVVFSCSLFWVTSRGAASPWPARGR